MSINAEILKGIVKPRQGNLPRILAEYLLTLDFSPSAHRRHATLSRKAQSGKLTRKDRAELEDMLTLNTFLTVVQSKARASLSRGNRAA